MRYFNGSGYILVVNIIPLIFLLSNDSISHTAVQAIYTESVDSERGESEYSEYDGLTEEGARYRKKAFIPRISKILKNKKYQRIFMGAVALILVTIGIKSAYERKNREYNAFLADLAKLKQLGRKLDTLTHQLVKLFWDKANLELYDFEVQTLSSFFVHQFKNEFFKDSNEEEKLKKKIVWDKYLLPYYMESVYRAKRQSAGVLVSIKKKLANLGYTDPALNNYDVHGTESVQLNEAALYDIAADLKTKSNRREDYRKVEYFCENYKKFFDLRSEFLTLRKKVFDFIATKHEDVNRLGLEFSKSIQAD